MNEIVVIKNLSLSFEGNDKRLLDVEHLALAKGKITALIGASGSGKSLTSLALMGLLPKNAIVSGDILFERKNLIHLPENEWRHIRGNEIAMIFQEPMSALNPLIKVGEQIKEIVKAHKPHSDSDATALVIEWLDKVQLPEPHKTYYKYPHQLSGGQKQRIMIAMAMINNPKLLIADEPTTALDVLVQQEIIALIQDLQVRYDTTVLFITHDLLLAQKIADEIIEMDQGKVVARSLRQQYIPYKSLDTQSKLPLLQVKNVSVDYVNNGVKSRAVDDVSFTVYHNQVLGLVGGSGCGKTTISKAILGLQAISEGEIWYQDTPLHALSTQEWRAVRRDIQIIFQDPYAALNPRIKVGDAIREPMLVHRIHAAAQAKAEVIKLLAQVNLSASDYDKYPHEFSGGQRQRICIARALALRPKLIICDESVAALDIKVRDQVLSLLSEIQRTQQIAYIFITHDMSVVRKICDSVIVMQEGKIVEEGSAVAILENPQHPYTQALAQAALILD